MAMLGPASAVTAANWDQLGRTALLKTSKADVDLHLGGWGHWPSVLQIPPQTLARMDHPARLSQLETGSGELQAWCAAKKAEFGAASGSMPGPGTALQRDGKGW